MMLYLFRRGVLFFVVILAVLLVLVAIYARINAIDFSFTYLRIGLAATGIYAGFLIHANHSNEEYLKPRHERIVLLSFFAVAFFLVACLCYLTYTTSFPGQERFLLFVKIPFAFLLFFGMYTFVRFREASELPAYYAAKKAGTSLWRGTREIIVAVIVLLSASYCIKKILPDFAPVSLAPSASASSAAVGFPSETKTQRTVETDSHDYNHPSVRGNPEERFQLCTVAAWHGDAVAQNDLAVMYLSGEGTPLNVEKGMYWLESAASQGLAVADYNLGTLFYHGRLVPQDDAKAYLHFLRLSEQGVAQGYYFLGALYHEGRGVEKDPEKALSSFRLAAEKSYPAAEFRLGSFYLDGKIVEEDIRQGLLFIERAAKGGYAPAQWRLGNIFREGTIVLKNPIEAQKWFLLASAQGHERALHMSRILGRELEEEEKKIAAALAARLSPQSQTTSP